MSFKMAAPSRTQVLSLYRALLRESAGFSAYNYRTYAIRRIRDAFKENRGVSDVQEMQKLVNKAKENLEVIKRQVPLDLPSLGIGGMVWKMASNGCNWSSVQL
ncbi:LYR motif-containing protein 4 isoform X2 [Ambystoma mexicanum]|uniref:LYR motif-containing protein 4 isoform X2 n=1 Tax=Ambystoma mexicanum TaxID=8296 RepID=UPI0037E9A3A6